MIAVALAFTLEACGPTVGAWLNRVRPPAVPIVPSSHAAALHHHSIVVDLHADPLLWTRNLATRSTRGHVDLPRLRDGGVALQVFGIVTRFPILASIDRTHPRWPDAITLLAATSLWPLRTLTSLKERVLHQAAALHRVADLDGRFVIVRSRDDLERLLTRHAADPEVLGGLLDIEGAHALEGQLANLDAIEAAGVRMIGLAHFYDDAFAGSAHGVVKGGLPDPVPRPLPEIMRPGTFLRPPPSSPAVIRNVL